MEVSWLRSASMNTGRLIQLSNQAARVTCSRSLHSSTSLQQAKMTDQKNNLRSSIQRLHTPAEQLLYSSIRPHLKPHPLEYPEDSEEVPPTTVTPSSSQIISPTESLESISKPVQAHRPLAVVIAWLGARPKHIEKYSQIWIDRGFDVITESIEPADLLLPKQRAIPRVNRLVQTLYDLTSSGRHDEIVMHCFSVGGYIFGEMLHHLVDDDLRKSIQGDNPIDPREVLQKSIKGLIFDSLVNIEGMSRGVSRSMTNNPLLSSLIRRTIDIHLKLSHNFAGKYYELSSDFAHNNPLFHVPSMFLTSDGDYIGTPEMTEKLAGMWSDQGIPIRHTNFDNSEHVRHYVKHPELYEAEIDRFLQDLKLNAFKSD